MKHELIYRALKTPDGTILHSSHRHDYVTHEDKNGNHYMLDGGLDYCRRSVNGDEEIIEVYADEPFEKVRQYAYRIGYGKPGAEDYGKRRITFFKDMTYEHLKASIEYCNKFKMYTDVHYMLLNREVNYRDAGKAPLNHE